MKCCKVDSSTQAFWCLGYSEQILGLYWAATGLQSCLLYFIIPTNKQQGPSQAKKPLFRTRERELRVWLVPGLMIKKAVQEISRADCLPDLGYTACSVTVL